MPEELSTLVSRAVTTTELSSAARAVNGVPGGVALDPSRGTGLACGPHPWTVLLSRAAGAWPEVAEAPAVIAVAASPVRETERLQVHLVVELRPRGQGHEVVIRTSSGRRWASGTAQVGPDGMEFAIPLAFPGAAAEGRIAGTLTAGGVLTLTDARIPAPPPRKSAEPLPA